MAHDLSDHYRTLVEIHATPSWLWYALVEKMLASESGWTVKEAHDQVARFKGLPVDYPQERRMLYLMLRFVELALMLAAALWV
ncbi:MAG: hypothetical protein JO249_01590 [Acidobacteria bacterium]|nr:hypothetical protein [Acidobacteriota bacterium]